MVSFPVDKIKSYFSKFQIFTNKYFSFLPDVAYWQTRVSLHCQNVSHFGLARGLLETTPAGAIPKTGKNLLKTYKT
jgi:hypothetical protein